MAREDVWYLHNISSSIMHYVRKQIHAYHPLHNCLRSVNIPPAVLCSTVLPPRTKEGNGIADGLPDLIDANDMQTLLHRKICNVTWWTMRDVLASIHLITSEIWYILRGWAASRL